MSWLEIPIGSFLWLAVALDLTIQDLEFTHFEKENEKMSYMCLKALEANGIAIPQEACDSYRLAAVIVDFLITCCFDLSPLPDHQRNC